MGSKETWSEAVFISAVLCQGSQIFNWDPIIGCSFDTSEMLMAVEDGEYCVGKFVTITRTGQKGRIVVIGVNVKYDDGTPFTLLGILSGSSLNFKPSSEVSVE